jgi:hypothetical protein
MVPGLIALDIVTLGIFFSRDFVRFAEHFFVVRAAGAFPAVKTGGVDKGHELVGLGFDFAFFPITERLCHWAGRKTC